VGDPVMDVEHTHAALLSHRRMSLVHLLAAAQPAIPIRPAAVRVLSSPPQFHATLIVRLRSRRLSRSSSPGHRPSRKTAHLPLVPLPRPVRAPAGPCPPVSRPRRSPAPASIPRHRPAPEHPSPPPPRPRLQPLHPPRLRLPRPRPSPPPARLWLQGPRLPLSQPKPQPSHDRRRPSPLQRGLGHLARKNIRSRRRRHRQRVSLASPRSRSR